MFGGGPSSGFHVAMEKDGSLGSSTFLVFLTVFFVGGGWTDGFFFISDIRGIGGKLIGGGMGILDAGAGGMFDFGGFGGNFFGFGGADTRL